MIAIQKDKEGYWSDDPDYPATDWQYEVANGDTRRGYHEWVAAKREMNMKIVVRSTAKVSVEEKDCDCDGDTFRPATPGEMERLPEITAVSDEWSNFAEYLPENLAAKISGDAYMVFKYDKLAKHMVVSVTYTLTDQLTNREIKELEAYTQGQWSDGIGENYEQQIATQTSSFEDVYISAWHDGQVITSEII